MIDERFSMAQIDCCTIITQSYQAQLRTLVRSYRRFHDGGRFFAVFIDGIPSDFDAKTEACDPVLVEEMGIPGLEALRMRYSVKDFCAAIRPYILRYFLEQRGSAHIVCMDSDLYFLGPLTSLPSLFAQYSVLLTPQLTAPFPDDKAYPEESYTLGSGVFNSGFVAMKRCAESVALLSWWSDRLRKYCYRRPEEYMFGDQKWLDLAPYFFKGIFQVPDPSYNVAFWNLHERPLEYRDGRFTARGVPVTFFHMSEFRVGTPPIYSIFMPPHDLISPLGHLCKLYQQDLLDAGYERATLKPYAFDAFDNGVRVSPIIRRIFEQIEEQKHFDGLLSTGEGSYFSWLLKPASQSGPDGGSLTNLHVQLHRLTLDALILFPTLRGKEAGQFAGWLSLPLQAKKFSLDPVFTKTLKPLADRAQDGEAAGLFRSFFHGREQARNANWQQKNP